LVGLVVSSDVAPLPHKQISQVPSRSFLLQETPSFFKVFLLDLQAFQKAGVGAAVRSVRIPTRVFTVFGSLQFS